MKNDKVVYGVIQTFMFYNKNNKKRSKTMKKILPLILLTVFLCTACTYSKEQVSEIITLTATFITGLVGVLVGAGTTKLRK